jgi:hypothetical protein
MTASLIPMGRSSGLIQPRGLARKERTQIERAGAARAYKVQAIGVITQIALQEVSALSALEGRLISATPLAEERLRLLVDTATGAMASHIARMANE